MLIRNVELGKCRSWVLSLVSSPHVLTLQFQAAVTHPSIAGIYRVEIPIRTRYWGKWAHLGQSGRHTTYCRIDESHHFSMKPARGPKASPASPMLIMHEHSYSESELE